jgi:hypothetical protein
MNCQRIYQLPILTIFFGFSFFSFLAESRTVVLSSRTIEKQFNQGDLNRIKFLEYKKRVDITGDPVRFGTYLSDTRFAYSVTAPSLLEDYAVVQWIRGCMFHSNRTQSGTEKTLTIYRRHFDEDKIFQHRDWEIDSDTHDPIYSSYAEHGRFALLRWNKDPLSLNPQTATYYEAQKPPHGSVFVTDMPGPSGLGSGDGKSNGSAVNSSLDFRTCLFRSADLPLVTTPEGAGIATENALWCADWSQHLVWDFKAGKMSQPSQLDSVCDMKRDLHP